MSGGRRSVKRERTPHRRGHTRWLMVVPLTGLALIIAGVLLLEALTPLTGPIPHPVEDLPPLAVHDDRPCTRGADEATIEEIRTEQVESTGRITSTQVYLCPMAFDQLVVTYAGEVVGELLPRRGGAWAQINDDPYALRVGPLVGHREQEGFNTGLSVWLPDGLHEQVEATGRAGRRGDVVLIDGTLVRADPADGGGLTLRATALETLAPPVEMDEPLHVLQAVVAGILALGALTVIVWARRER